MSDRKEFEMSEEQLKQLLEAGQPVVAIWGSDGVMPPSPQDNANRAWQALGRELGFVWDTVQPVSGKGQRVFSAVATPTGEAK